MTAIVLRNKRIGANQFVFAGGGMKLKRGDNAAPIDDKIDSQEIPKLCPCPSSDITLGDPPTVDSTSTKNTLAKLLERPRWMYGANGKDDTEQQSKARQTAKTALQKRFERMVETSRSENGSRSHGKDLGEPCTLIFERMFVGRKAEHVPMTDELKKWEKQ